jgi:hypothetical protein
VIDPDALTEFLDDDPDAAMALLADMVAATDEQLRELARAQAGRVMVEAARSGPQRRRGVGRLRRVKLSQAEGDVDVDASLDALVAARGTATAPDPAEVVSDLLRLRGFGVTDVGLALRTAAAQLSRSTAGRRVAVLLSDCRTTSGGDPLGHLAGVDELVVLAPEDDTADAEALAEAVGARWTTVGGPSSVAEALVHVLGPSS